MKFFKNWMHDARRQRGLALIIVLSMLALSTIVMLAFLTVAETEHRSTVSYSSSQSARRLADVALNLVIGQIRAGSDQDRNVPGREIHATQPGAVRKYNQDGAFLAGYKLFSDRDMIYYANVGSGAPAVAAERNFVLQSEPEPTWNTGVGKEAFVDINEPVIKGVASATGTIVDTQTHFPVIDPRAAFDVDQQGDELPVEGFQYATSTALGSNLDLNSGATGQGTAPVVLPGSAAADRLRLAMPLRWLYMLRDGSMGTMKNAGTQLEYVGSGTPSANNPIVARLAFWADDETCKINVNTAAEPTFLGTPRYYHERDKRWADYTARRNEYQRFPGHPATVALSSVLYPNPRLDSNLSLDPYPAGRVPLTGSSADLQQRILPVKNRIYQIVPKVAAGGSNAGTSLFAEDQYSQGSAGGISNSVVLTESLSERLYSSMDELVFRSTGFQATSGRTRTNNGQDFPLFTDNTLERASAFLTASSRGSEISMLGLPRIAMWPISNNANTRSGFDKLIAFCSTVGGNGYYFQRSSNYLGQQVAPNDANLSNSRNAVLLSMLDKILSTAVFPGSTAQGTQGSTFGTKLGTANYRQLIISMFEYIRCSNLYDSYFAADFQQMPVVSLPGAGTEAYFLQLFNLRDNQNAQQLTATPGFVKTPGENNVNKGVALPGHGQLSSSRWNGPGAGGSTTYRGLGRSITISEIGLQFICTADGQPDQYSWRNLQVRANPANGQQELYVPMGFNPTAVDLDAAAALGLSGTAHNPTVPFGTPGVAMVSGGRTALKLENQTGNTGSGLRNAFYQGFDETTRLQAMLGALPINLSGPGGGQGAPPVVNWGKDLTTPNNFVGRYYSNYPPISPGGPYAQGGLYGTVNSINPNPVVKAAEHWQNHPGYQPENWNYTLDPDTPLKPDEKRLQAMIHFEFFCPMVGYPEIYPEFTIVIGWQGVQNIVVENNGVQQFPFLQQQDYVLKSAGNIYDYNDGRPQVGGFATFRRLVRGRPLKGTGSAASGGTLVADDPGYAQVTNAQVHQGLMSFDLVSAFFTVKDYINQGGAQVAAPLSFRNSSLAQPLQIKIYDSHNYQNSQPVQQMSITFPPPGAPAVQCPIPDLVTMPSGHSEYVDNAGQVVRHNTLQAPHWWTFHQRGPFMANNVPVAGNFSGGTPALQASQPGSLVAGRLWSAPGFSAWVSRTAGGGVLLPGIDNLIYSGEGTGFSEVGAGAIDMNQPYATVRQTRIQYATRGTQTLPAPAYGGGDVVRTLLPGHGDARIIYAKTQVTPADWVPHPKWSQANKFMAHNFAGYSSSAEPGFDNDPDNDYGILPDFNIGLRTSDFAPDAPPFNPATSSLTLSPVAAARRYYDYDDADPGGRIGSYVNKPDEGNVANGIFQPTGWNQPVNWRSTYFRADVAGASFSPAGRSFFSPNRIISSPVMFGSLPPYVYFANPLGVNPLGGNGNGAWTNLLFRPHVLINLPAPNAQAIHPGQTTPPDHYLLDLFWMPVVEPYAISEPLSTAGKINMNYQMLPFTHIRRATALHAAMKGEIFAALPNSEYLRARKDRRGFGNQGSTQPVYQNEEVGLSNAAARWHRSIAIDRMAQVSGAAEGSQWWEMALGQRVMATLRQFEERFNFGGSVVNFGPTGVGGSSVNAGLVGAANFRSGLFRSPSQICELHLIPNPVSTAGNAAGANINANENISTAGLSNPAAREAAMSNFWTNHIVTGDNTREAIYSNLYAKLTTRSNTFRVHVRVQTLRKAQRASTPQTWDPSVDEITGEYRGSFLLERYVDPADLQAAGAAVDYAQGNPMDDSRPTLDSFYRFRVLEAKRFAP